jgi:hypothetical protein
MLQAFPAKQLGSDYGLTHWYTIDVGPDYGNSWAQHPIFPKSQVFCQPPDRHRTPESRAEPRRAERVLKRGSTLLTSLETIVKIVPDEQIFASFDFSTGKA